MVIIFIFPALTLLIYTPIPLLATTTRGHQFKLFKTLFKVIVQIMNRVHNIRKELFLVLCILDIIFYNCKTHMHEHSTVSK